MMKKVAVLIPCYNEEMTVTKVVTDFRRVFQDADIYVYDNNSTDQTARLAREAGAIVRSEHRQGKGNVVRTMFREIDADAYVLVDGDDTYPAEEAEKLVKPVLEDGIDMAIGDRLSNGTYFSENKKQSHDFGNRLVRNLINQLFHSDIHDIMTGYRVFSRRFVKCMPVRSEGFQIETEMTIFSLVSRMNICEIPITYRDRPEGSYSKINTVSDGIKVLVMIFDLFKDYRPFYFFFILFVILLAIGLAVGIPGIAGYEAGRAGMGGIAASIILIVSAVALLTAGIQLDAVKNQTQTLFEQRISQFEQEEKNRK